MEGVLLHHYGTGYEAPSGYDDDAGDFDDGGGGFDDAGAEDMDQSRSSDACSVAQEAGEGPSDPLY